MEHVVVHHYNLESLTVVIAVNLFDHIKATLTKNKIPFSKIVSNLPESTNYMRERLVVSKHYSERRFCIYLISMEIYATMLTTK